MGGRQTDRFADVAAVADAVLFEGYLLYPYRASAQKNQVRWQWGVLVPQGYGAGFRGDVDQSHRVPGRAARAADAPARTSGFATCTWSGAPCSTRTAGRSTALDVGDVRHVPFDEGLPRHVDATFDRAETAGRRAAADPGARR